MVNYSLITFQSPPILKMVSFPEEKTPICLAFQVYLVVQVLRVATALLTTLHSFGCPVGGLTCLVSVSYVFK